MSPAAIADVRVSIARFTLDQARGLAEIALAADGAAEARDAVRAAISEALNHNHDSQEMRQTSDTTSAAPAPAKKPGRARVGVQRFGTFLSGMVMPNIPAFIAGVSSLPCSSRPAGCPTASSAAAETLPTSAGRGR